MSKVGRIIRLGWAVVVTLLVLFRWTPVDATGANVGPIETGDLQQASSEQNPSFWEGVRRAVGAPIFPAEDDDDEEERRVTRTIRESSGHLGTSRRLKGSKAKRSKRNKRFGKRNKRFGKSSKSKSKRKGKSKSKSQRRTPRPTPRPPPRPTTAIPVTGAPTTASPTTAIPTTASPTTAIPTTRSPTTAGPTAPANPTVAPGSPSAAPTTTNPTVTLGSPSSQPTTSTPTTASPTTTAPTSAGPTVTPGSPSAAPTTVAPTTASPTTGSPSTAAPTTGSPTTGGPTTNAPSTVSPTTTAPTTTNPTAGASAGAALLRGGIPLIITEAKTAAGATNAPTTRQQCRDNVRHYHMNVDVHIRYLGDKVVPCDKDRLYDSRISRNIQDALNRNFAATVTDWHGRVAFGPFVFDTEQQVDNLKGMELGRDSNLHGRFCPKRTIACPPDVADTCRWGCLTIETTDCGNPRSNTTSWSDSLSGDIQNRLASLGYACLGISDQLRVVVTEPTVA